MYCVCHTLSGVTSTSLEHHQGRVVMPALQGSVRRLHVDEFVTDWDCTNARHIVVFDPYLTSAPASEVTSPRDHLTSRPDMSLIGCVYSYHQPPALRPPLPPRLWTVIHSSAEQRWLFCIVDRRFVLHAAAAIAKVFTVRSLALPIVRRRQRAIAVNVGHRMRSSHADSPRMRICFVGLYRPASD